MVGAVPVKGHTHNLKEKETTRTPVENYVICVLCVRNPVSYSAQANHSCCAHFGEIMCVVR